MEKHSDFNEEANGFLVLDYCDIYIGKFEAAIFSNDKLPKDPWLDVKIPSPQGFGNNSSRKTQTSRDGSSKNSIVEKTVGPCPRSSLVLAQDSSFRETKQLNIVGIDGSNGPRYDGTIRDTKCHSENANGKQRSDAALLLGLALLSQDFGHISIRSIKVGLYEFSAHSSEANTSTFLVSTTSTSTDSTAQDKNNVVYQKAKACLMITFWCREVAMPTRGLPNHNRRFFQEGTKQLLHPSTQLIMSIMSSDWQDYDAKIAQVTYSWKSFLEHGKERKYFQTETSIQNNETKSISQSQIHRTQHRIPNLSFFPSKMNLEDVFLRISGVSPSLLLSNPEFDSERTSKKENTEQAVYRKGSNAQLMNGNHEQQDKNNVDANAPRTTIASLPADILCNGIAQFLRAKSLDSLRCTCKHVHWTLRAVVPGLKLRLYSHQIKSLMWMRGRESKDITEDDLVQNTQCRHRRKEIPKQLQMQTMTQWIKNTPDGDVHRAATGGGSVVLRRRPRPNGKNDNVHENAESVRISQFDHTQVMERQKSRNNPLARKVARGGLLCDDPGLGKTITVLSLILQTLGLTTEDEISNNKNGSDSKVATTTKGISTESRTAENINSIDDIPKNQEEAFLTADDEQIFEEYWKEQIIPEFRCKALLKLFNSFLRCSQEINYFFDNFWVKDLRARKIDVPEPSISLKSMRRRIDKSLYGDSILGFVADVESCFKIAISNENVSPLLREAAGRLLIIFRNEINSFKRRQVDIAMKSFSRASAKPDSMVAALIERNNAEKLRKALLPSSGTLMVVPAVLVDHWVEQIRLNVDLSYCTERVPIIFHYNGTTQSNLRIQEIKNKCLLDRTHFPLVFVDRTATKKLPPPKFLAMFKIILTTNNRFSNEWKNGSFEDEIRRSDKRDNRRGEENGRISNFREDLATSDEACSLLKVNWLRMIVDEGHSMGRGRDNSSISFASWINAERRWAMTGTPTPQTSSQSGLMNVLNLMQYLQHDFFTRRHSGDVTWSKLIVKNWNIGNVSSFFRLRSLLSMLMIRHVKSDIAELPLPIFSTNTLSMGFEEVSTYNTLVCAVQSNLIITSMKGKTSGAQDSLLHKSQSKHAREALGNLRLVCAGGTQVLPTLSTEYWVEFHQDFDNINADPVQRKKIRDFISNATSGRQSKCDCCSVVLSTLLVFPCGHLVCTECVDSNTTSCVVCEKEFDVDEFQRLQPGFQYKWLHNVEEEVKRQSSGNNPTAENANEPSLLPDGAGVLVPQNQRQRRARTRKYDDGHTCEYDPKNPNGQCALCFTEHEPCYLAKNRRCEVCHRVAQDCPTSESKITHIIQKLLCLYKQQQATKLSAQLERKGDYESDSFLLGRRRTPKVIIFSQFRKVLNITGDRLLRRLGSGCIAEYWGKYRKKELNKFIKDEQCICMLLGKDGSEGLDLSFVTHIIFLEQVWDKSLENQVVARAWRMGATGPVDVETLVAENSIEESMFFLERNLEQDQGDGFGSSSDVRNFRSTTKDKKRSEYQQAKISYLLSNSKLIVDASTVDFSSSNKRKALIDLDTAIEAKLSGAKKSTEKNGRKRPRVTFQLENHN